MKRHIRTFSLVLGLLIVLAWTADSKTESSVEQIKKRGIKTRSDVKLFVMTQNNRNELLSEILKVSGTWIETGSSLPSNFLIGGPA